MNWKFGLLVFFLLSLAIITLVSLGFGGKEAIYYHELNTQA